MDNQKYLLPYQVNWLKDKSKIKIWEKSRRIGATYVQSYEDVEDCIHKRVPSVWFSSADESAAKEYILYCAMWAKMFNVVARQFDAEVFDGEKNIKTFTIEFSNGTRINALSSNPKAFRSKGGKVILDEFGWHDRADEMWKAARPVITWGFPLRILSTHNGKSCLYFRFVDQSKAKKLPWSLHTTTIVNAVEDGLVDKILSRKTTPMERQQWLDDERAACGDENTWLQEYMCVAVDEASAFLTYDLIYTCEDKSVLWPEKDWPFTDYQDGNLFLGMDIGRKKDLSVLWLLELLGTVRYTRAVRVLNKMPFRKQFEILTSIMKHRKMRRACIDASGLGMQLAEDAQADFGKYRVEAVTFTGPVKEELAYPVLTTFQDKQVIIPDDFTIRESLHSVKKTTTAAGNIRFDAARGDSGHADEFWALALGIHAAGGINTGVPKVTSRSAGRNRSFLDRFMGKINTGQY